MLMPKKQERPGAARLASGPSWGWLMALLSPEGLLGMAEFAAAFIGLLAGLSSKVSKYFIL
jgi:hypothetical protein